MEKVKKNIKAIAMVLALILMLPLALTLAACGATPSNEVRGVFFQSDKYDIETGYAIFEVDLNEPTTLSYKVNPSTWSGYRVTYTFEDSAANHEFYNVIDGVITVISPNFSDVKVNIHINGQSDTCIVTLKKYPDRFYVEETDIYLNSSGLYSIKPVGEYINSDNTVRKVYLTETDYKFSLISNDETKVQLINENRLEVFAVSKTNGDSTTVTINLLDTKGNVKNYPQTNGENAVSPMTAIVKITIVPNVADARLKLSSESAFVKNGGTASITSPTETYKIDFEIYFLSKDFDENGILIKVPVRLTINSDEKDVVQIDEEGQTITINSTAMDLQINISIITNLYGSNGAPFTFTFTINYSYGASYGG